MLATGALLLAVFVGGVIAAAISATVGFGGALLLLPLLSRVVGVEAAVPLLTFAQLVGNLSRAAFGFREIRWRPALVFVAIAIPASVLGSVLFVEIEKTLLVRIVGAILLIFVVIQLRSSSAWQVRDRHLLVSGAIVGFISGLVGSAGPLGAAVFLALDLPPVACIATEAVTAVLMHSAKMATYGFYLSFGSREWEMAGLLAASMLLGSWLGKRTVERIPVRRFRIVVDNHLDRNRRQQHRFG